MVHSPARGVISGLVSHYTSVRAGLLVSLDSVKILINMFESIYCCVVFIQTMAGIQDPRERQQWWEGLRLAARSPEWSWCCLAM